MRTTLLYGGISLAVVALGVGIFFLVRYFRKEKKVIKEVMYWYYQNVWLANAFNNFDVAVYGFRGAGKDLIFAHGINEIGQPHYSNIWYNHNTEVRDLQDIHVGGNSFRDFIEGNIQQFIPNFVDGRHFYISDAGVYLACQHFKELDKVYNEMPIHFALRRQLHDSHIHTNSQALGRVWDKLREQQGCFIHCLGTVDYGDFFIVSAVTYTKYESALACLPPPKVAKGKNVDKYEVMRHGEIVERSFKIYKSTLSYDTRHFKSKLHLS